MRMALAIPVQRQEPITQQRWNDDFPPEVKESFIDEPALLVSEQARWDRFFASQLADLRKVSNLALREDMAMDRTIRALGRRPRAPLTPTEREELQIRSEVEEHFRDTCRVHNHGQQDPVNRAREAKLAKEKCS